MDVSAATSAPDADLPVIAFANRLPVRRTRNAWRLSDGGLVAALRPAMRSRGGVWVGWDGGTETPRHVPGLDFELRPVSLSRREVDAYYHGFANRTLWPLLHGLVEQPTFDRASWDVYRRVNAHFAGSTTRPSPGCGGCTTTTCSCCPALLRARGSVGPDRVLPPHPVPAARGLRAAPVAGERARRDARRRRRLLPHAAVPRQLPAHVRAAARRRARGRDGRAAARRPRRPHGRAPDLDRRRRRRQPRAQSPASSARSRGLQAQFAPRRLLLGVDRLDYTKGIPERLRAIELLLEMRPELRRWITFVQVAVPSRGEIREYRELRAQVEQLVGRINGRFTEPGLDVPDPLPLPRGHPGPAARLLPRRRRLPRDAACRTG